MIRPEAVVFDCDGVLVDSEPHSVRAWLAVLGDLGHPGTAADIERCTGLGFLPTRERLLAGGPLPDPADLWPRLLEALEGSFRTGLTVFPDAVALLDRCAAAAVPVAVASASPRDRLDLTLKVAGLGRRFAVSVAGDEVDRGKPAPDVYLAATAALRVDPARTVAIEDSPIGARAGVAAGMRVIGVARRGGATLAALAAAGADAVTALAPEAIGL